MPVELTKNQLQTRLEVMHSMESQVSGYIQKYLVPVETIWQPSDFLPQSNAETFYADLKTLREESLELDYDFWIVLIGDMVTEEALPSYESWLMGVKGIDQIGENTWSAWVRQWTAEENRHGDVLNKYLYLSGRVNMREVEKTVHYLLSDGFDIGTASDPYKNFVYTSFQELATHLSHKRVSEMAQQKGNDRLTKMCRTIAGDEMRHHLAYRQFVSVIFEADPSEILCAFADMMRNKISMPAHMLRQSGEKSGASYEPFSHAAQRLGIYTSADYIFILRLLLVHWQVDKRNGLNENAEKARDYLMALPARLERLSERIKIPKESVKFKWVDPWGM
jgi:acyl-[acyl-carrier-protein] desaturase